MEDVNLSFSGCGFLGIYHVGVASCIKQYAPSLFQNKIMGASAGALVGCVLMCGCCLGQCTSYTLRLASKARQRALGPLHPEFDLIRHLRQGLEEILPIDAHIRCTGRLFVSVTRVSDGENVLLSNFPTREHLIQALMCSTFIPLYSGMTPPTFDGVAYVDGAFSNNLPKFTQGATITVCPFAGESDICPRDQHAAQSMLTSIVPVGTPFLLTDVNVNRLSQVLFPPHPVDLAKICQDGFRDALRFLSLSGYINKIPDIIQLQACVSSAKNMPVSKFGGNSSITSDDDSGAEIRSQRVLQRRNSLESNVYQRYRRRAGSMGSTENLSKARSPPSTLRKGSVNLPPKRSPKELNFLPPLARREFMHHLEQSEGVLYTIFHSKAYRICSVLASPLYLPGELCWRLTRNVIGYSFSCAKSLYNGTLGRVFRMFEYVYSTAVLYSPIVITSQPDGRLICSLDVVADRLNTDTAESYFRKPTHPEHKRESVEDTYSSSPNLSHLVHLHMNSSSDQPENLRRLARGPVDSEAATACLDTLIQRGSTDSIDNPMNESLPEQINKMRRSQTDSMLSVPEDQDTAKIEQLVGGRSGSNVPPVLSYYYPDPQTDRLLVWELKELDHTE